MLLSFVALLTAASPWSCSGTVDQRWRFADGKMISSIIPLGFSKTGVFALGVSDDWKKASSRHAQIVDLQSDRVVWTQGDTGNVDQHTKRLLQENGVEETCPPLAVPGLDVTIEPSANQKQITIWLTTAAGRKRVARIDYRPYGWDGGSKLVYLGSVKSPHEERVALLVGEVAKGIGPYMQGAEQVMRLFVFGSTLTTGFKK